MTRHSMRVDSKLGYAIRQSNAAYIHIIISRLPLSENDYIALFPPTRAPSDISTYFRMKCHARALRFHKQSIDHYTYTCGVAPVRPKYLALLFIIIVLHIKVTVGVKSPKGKWVAIKSVQWSAMYFPSRECAIWSTWLYTHADVHCIYYTSPTLHGLHNVSELYI